MTDASITRNLEHLGKKFDWWDWAGWFPFITKWTKAKIKAPTHSFDKMICVDYVMRVLNNAGIARLPYGVMSPELLRQWCEYNYEELGWIMVNGPSNETLVCTK